VIAFLRRVAKIVAAAFAFLLYVWFAAVMNAARAKRRKRLRRADRAR
jgi:hypothetical protein